jgi:hypothetical protein
MLFTRSSRVARARSGITLEACPRQKSQGDCVRWIGWVQPRFAPAGEDRRGYALDEFVALHSSPAVTACRATLADRGSNPPP